MKQKALAREDRKRQILFCFSAAILSQLDTDFTVADIARVLHLTPSTKLREMITELVEDGALLVREEAIPGHCKFRRVYSPNPKHFKRPKVTYRGDNQREIKINTRQGSFFEVLNA